MRSRRISQDHKLLLVRCVVVFCVTALVTGLVIQPSSAEFDVKTASQDQSSGPAVGETLNLRAFQSRSGDSLFEAMKGHSLAMVVFVHPNCTTCTSSKDYFRQLRQRVAEPKIPYFVLMVTDGSDPQKYFSYADSLKLDAEAFVWSTTEGAPPSSLLTMVVPSHVLVTGEGLIVNKWLGAPESASICLEKHYDDARAE